MTVIREIRRDGQADGGECTLHRSLVPQRPKRARRSTGIAQAEPVEQISDAEGLVRTFGKVLHKVEDYFGPGPFEFTGGEALVRVKGDG